MSEHEFFVYPDGAAIECKQLLLARTAGILRERAEVATSRVAGDPAALGQPITQSGTLNTTERYSDPKHPNRFFQLPTYAIATVQADTLPLQRYDVRLEWVDVPDHQAVARLTVRLVGSIPAGALPLPHDLTVSMRYVVIGQDSAAAVSTWKTLVFDQLVEQGEMNIEAVLHLHSLPELDTVYQVMSRPEHRCQILVHCTADLSYQTLAQIYVEKRLPKRRLRKNYKFEDVKMEVLPTARATFQQVAQKPRVSFRYQEALEEARREPVRNPYYRVVDQIQPVFSFQPPGMVNLPGMTRPPIGLPDPVIRPPVHLPDPIIVTPIPDPIVVTPIPDPVIVLPPLVPVVTLPPVTPIDNIFLPPEVLISIGDAAVLEPVEKKHTYTDDMGMIVQMSSDTLVAHTTYDRLAQTEEAHPHHLSTKGLKELPSRFFTDVEGNPAFVRLRLSFDQVLPFSFPESLHGYIYPNRQTEGNVALAAYQVSADQIIYQDTMQRNLFYYLPDEFRLTRAPVADPLYKPALQVAFYTLTAQGGLQNETNGGEKGATSYNVHFVFRAVPYLQPGRQQAATNFIIQQQLAPNAAAIVLVPLIPESTRLVLHLPGQDGGIVAEEQTDALFVLPEYIVDTVKLPVNLFQSVFNSMNGSGETMNGAVMVRLPGRPEEHPITFNGRLDMMLGEMFAVGEVSAVDGQPGCFQFSLRNATESKVTLNEVLVQLVTNQVTRQGVLAEVVDGLLPMTLESRQTATLTVRAPQTVTKAWSAAVQPIRAQVDLDFPSLWRLILETPGWNDITHQVKVEVKPEVFTGPNALSKVVVTFNQEEALTELTAAKRTETVTLTKPFLGFLFADETANDYTYRVESYRTGADGVENLVGLSAEVKDDAPELEVRPPLEIAPQQGVLP